MIHGQDCKYVVLFAPGSVATNGTASGTVSVAGFRYAEVVLQMATALASNVDATIAISEGDTTSSFATHADTNIVTVAPNTSTPQQYVWLLDLRKRKKNLKIQYNPSTNAARVAAAWVRLSRPEVSPDTATEMGVDLRTVV